MATDRNAGLKLTRALTVENVLSAKFKGLKLNGKWGSVIGSPEIGKNWLCWGQSGSGKTTGIMQLVKELSQHETVIYNSLEEWPSSAIQKAFKRAGLLKGDKVMMVGEDMKSFEARMKRQRSPRIMIIDSVRYTKFRWDDYLRFSELFDNRLKIWVSHADGKEPKGALAADIRYDSAVKIYTEGFRAFITSRYSDQGGGSVDIWPEGAMQYWAESND